MMVQQDTDSRMDLPKIPNVLSFIENHSVEAIRFSVIVKRVRNAVSHTMAFEIVFKSAIACLNILSS